MWEIYFWVSVSILIIVGSGVIANRRKYVFYMLFGGVFISSVFMFLPLYLEMFQMQDFSVAKALLLSIQNTIRLFVVDGDFSFVVEYTENLKGWLRAWYQLLFALLFVVTPVLTSGLVLSFFKNVSAYILYWLHFFSDAYIFSELNEKSIELAKDLKKNEKKRLIVFTEVYDANDELSYELLEQAKNIGIIAFKKDVTTIKFDFHSKKRKLTFFQMGEDEAENVRQSLALIKCYQKRENTEIFVFAQNVESELVFSATECGMVKVRRINETRALINRFLYNEGIKIFRGAKDGKISAVVVGMGGHGFEMTRALPWFCQMDGYEIHVNAFDVDSQVSSHFHRQCPELMDSKHNGDFTTEGEAHYEVKIHARVDVWSDELLNELYKLDEITYIFIALGDDESNIRMATELRTEFEKRGIHPQIDAIVCDATKIHALNGIKNYSGQEFDVYFIGDRKESYSEEVILDSDVEEAALARHLKWGKEEDFWKYEYNYRSSIASAIHRKMKIECGIPGADQLPEEREESARQALRVLEHRRWNAYMRAEGFTYAEKRNNLAKTHNCLVPFAELSEKDREKDDD